jgi:hypothetical protein
MLRHSFFIKMHTLSTKDDFPDMLSPTTAIMKGSSAPKFRQSGDISLGIRQYQASCGISDSLSGRRMKDITETSLRLTPENIDQALPCNLELFSERSNE